MGQKYTKQVEEEMRLTEENSLSLSLLVCFFYEKKRERNERNKKRRRKKNLFYVDAGLLGRQETVDRQAEQEAEREGVPKWFYDLFSSSSSFPLILLISVLYCWVYTKTDGAPLWSAKFVF